MIVRRKVLCPTNLHRLTQKRDLSLEIAHLLFIDVVGYSKLLVNEQVELMQKLNGVVRATPTFRRAEAAGKLTRLPTGDGMVLLFSRSPEEPVKCALEISEGLRDQPHIRLRMGIHSGPVNQVMDVNDQINMAGAAINIGQRVMDCGDAGHILVSQHVAEDLTQYAHWRSYLQDLGECQVKHGLRLHVFNLAKDGVGNLQLPEKFKRIRRWKDSSGATVRLIRGSRWRKLVLAGVLVFAIAAGYFLVPQIATRSKTEKSVAVLPFENLSRDPDNAYFAVGIQDEILTRLSKIADLKVISRTSTQRYKSAPGNLPEIAKQLGVSHIVEGSVQKSGDAVRVNVQLIKAVNDSHLWAETFDRNLANIFSVESEVAKALADQLQAKLSGREEQVIAAKPTDNVEAYDDYLRGLAYTLMTEITPRNALAAQKYLKEAVRLDPKFALAWAVLSYVDARGYLALTLQPTIALRDEAQQAAEAALRLQPNLGEALVAKGFYHYACLKDYDTAERYLEQAHEFLPNSSRIPESLAYITRRRGDWNKSETYFNEAERLDPRNVDLLTQHAVSYSSRRFFTDALGKLDQVLNIVPDDLDTLAEKAGIAQGQGDLARAAALLGPLHPAADDTPALETQLYQAILERNSAPILSRLKEILAKPDPALGFSNGELRFWLGWAQAVEQDHAGAQESWNLARAELESFLKQQPDNYLLLADLALTDMALGDKSAASALSERAMAALPIEKDALNGPFLIEVIARIAAQSADSNRAIDALQKLLSTPYEPAFAAYIMPLTPSLLRLDPMFDPIRNDPRFQKLIASPLPNNRGQK